MATDTWLQEAELEGDTVTLIPLRRQHADALLQAASDGNLWDLWYTSVPNAETMENYLDVAIEEQSTGRFLGFVVVENATGEIVGTTRFCNADTKNKRVEIGYTWYAKRCQRTRVNTECKYLLLQHAFEYLNSIAVEFRTHWHNYASRAAITRLGAKQDGVLRNHQKSADGSYRDTVVFSIIDHEWAVVKKGLLFKLQSQ